MGEVAPVALPVASCARFGGRGRATVEASAIHCRAMTRPWVDPKAVWGRPQRRGPTMSALPAPIYPSPILC